MKKHMVLMTSQLMLTVLLVGCQQPIKDYKKFAKEMSLPHTLNEIEKLSSECAQKLDEFILNSTNGNNEELEGYSELDSCIISLKELVDNTMIKCENIEIIDQNVIETHQILLDALLKYEEEIIYLEEVTLANKDINDMQLDIQKLNDKILEVTVSGNPTSIEYKHGLEEFVEMNHETLKLFDVEHAKDVLGTFSLDEQFIINSVENARQTIETLKQVKTYNITDVTIHNLLIQMYERILDMYDYTIEHYEIIEWSNQYETFSEYIELQQQGIAKDINKWQKASGMLE